ncbi:MULTISPECIES: hypothetical protein [Streptacidiphilus]|uniref:Carboxypeptidase regulatory-like domain-containing protein n=1 Tax=Streptacidiphilus cavernicola TaxID=3342716 RepID=A0ABV6USI7_9ACTN|nr:hypothetical protein [Streptacidiphilus jeojiense]
MLLLACCGTTVGCTGTAGHSRTSSGTGTISGTVVSVGGPYPGSMAEIAAEVTGSGTSRFSVRSSATDGFSLSVPAGDYAVNAHLAGPCTAAQVSVPPGGTGTARIVCQVK